jgi:uncharacterized membrane protein YeaQ/YmgE (transglycosylase-associated protein family)
MDLVAWVVVGLLAGGIARRIVDEERRGCLYTLGIGVLGALVGGGLMRAAGFDGTDGFLLSLVTAVLGAMLLLLVLQALGRSSRASRSGSAGRRR